MPSSLWLVMQRTKLSVEINNMSQQEKLHSATISVPAEGAEVGRFTPAIGVLLKKRADTNTRSISITRIVPFPARIRNIRVLTCAGAAGILRSI